jgi:hypothetical protein
MHSNFLLGRLVVTETVQMRLKRTPFDLIARHAVNEYGSITPAERRSNNMSMKCIGQILSRYMVDPTDPKKGHILVVTDEDWQTTTVKLEGVDE